MKLIPSSWLSSGFCCPCQWAVGANIKVARYILLTCHSVREILENISAYNTTEKYQLRCQWQYLDNLFGENWHVVEFMNSSTSKRIIGLVIVHYRKKSIPKAMKMKYKRFSTLLCQMIFFQQIFTKKRFRHKTSSKCMTLCCSLFQFIQRITGNWK